MKKLTVVLCVLAMGCGIVLGAIESGMKEVSMQLSFQELKSDTESSSEDGMYNAMGQLVLNYFMVSHWSFGMTTRLNVYAEKDEEGKLDPSGTAFVMARTDLYLGASSWPVVPYIGGHGGYSIYAFKGWEGDAEWEGVVAYGGQGGFKIFAGERVSWNLEYDLTIFETDESSMDDELAAYGIEQEKEKLNISTISLGFSYYF